MICASLFQWLRGRRRRKQPVSWSLLLQHLDKTGITLRIGWTQQAFAALTALGETAGNGSHQSSTDLVEPSLSKLSDKSLGEPDATEYPDLMEQAAFTILNDKKGAAKVQRFLIDAPFLIKSARLILSETPQPESKRRRPSSKGKVNLHDTFKESFHYAAGLRVDSITFVINRIVQVDFALQSAIGVKVDDSSNILALARLDEMGIPLTAHFHSHPGFGLAVTRPSGTDLRFQETLERGGHVAIGGIFSRDGYLRFFGGSSRQFVVEVQGNHVEKIDTNQFKVALANGTGSGSDDPQR